ncbi:MAG: hypothetical protein QNL14_02400 [Deltaproteobacteria bacterium]|nr:hypothetical protein [Deltaproteobacteria bacterium]
MFDTSFLFTHGFKSTNPGTRALAVSFGRKFRREALASADSKAGLNRNWTAG